jgi:tryptophan 7-halogenase
MIHRIVILGGGSAGFMSALALQARLPQLEITILRSPEIGIIGVGEGTTSPVPQHLHSAMKLDPVAFHTHVKPTWKLGIKFLWGPRKYFNFTFSPQFSGQYETLPKPNGFYAGRSAEFADPISALMSVDKAFLRNPSGGPDLSRNNLAYHMENIAFVEFLEASARQRGIHVVDDTVASVELGEHGVKALLCKSGRRVEADFWVDCSGFFSFLLGKTLKVPFVSFNRSLFCDRAVVGGWERGPSEVIKPYTTAETMDSGWSWQIEHDHRVNRGYVFSSAFINDENAEAEFRLKNPKLGPTRFVRFISGFYERAWEKNVVAIGNSAGFVEPLESSSLIVICQEAGILAQSLAETDLEPGHTVAAAYNKWSRQTWESIRGFLAIHYKFNTRLNTPFWQACQQETDLGDLAEEFVAYFQENGPSLMWNSTIFQGHHAFVDPEGWITLMVGQDVPYRRRHVPGEAEQLAWKKIQSANWALAATGVSVEEMSKLVRSPEWRFPADFFKF